MSVLAPRSGGSDRCISSWCVQIKILLLYILLVSLSVGSHTQQQPNEPMLGLQRRLISDSFGCVSVGGRKRGKCDVFLTSYVWLTWALTLHKVKQTQVHSLILSSAATFYQNRITSLVAFRHLFSSFTVFFCISWFKSFTERLKYLKMEHCSYKGITFWCVLDRFISWT